MAAQSAEHRALFVAGIATHLLLRFAAHCAPDAVRLSMIGITAAATGHLSPVTGAVTQQGVDMLAVHNPLRAAFPPKGES